MSLAKETENKISEKNYLGGEKNSDIKYEYIDGYVYAMAGASGRHNTICTNTSSNF
ncbi:MAG: Uma2 family endonuclease [Pseudomonadota bacterium]